MNITHNGHTITLGENGHSWYLGDIKLISPSKMLSYCFPFDADAVASQCAGKGAYVGMTKEEVLKDWASRADKGSEVHKFAEEYLKNNKVIKVSDEAKPYAQSLYKFLNTSIIPDYEVLDLEKVVFDPEMETVGIIDILLKDKKTGEIIVGDFKVTDKLPTSSKWKAEYSFSSHSKCKFIQYSAQLWCYHIMLERNYMDMTNSKRVIFHVMKTKVKVMEAKDVKLEALEMMLAQKGETMGKGLPGARTKKKVGFVDMVKFIFGMPKIGKSTLLAKMKDDKGREPYFIHTDPPENYAHMDVFGQQVTTFSGFERIIGILENNKEALDAHSCVVVEIVSDLERFLINELIDSAKVQTLNDVGGGYGKGKNMKELRFLGAMNRLFALGKPIVFADHEIDKQKTTVNSKGAKSEVVIPMPRLDVNLTGYIMGKCGFIGYYFKESDGSRILSTKFGFGVGSHIDALDGINIEIDKADENVIKTINSIITEDGDKKGGE